MSHPVRIPADVELPDRVLAGLTARQLLILTAGAAPAYGIWWATRAWLPLPLIGGAMVPMLLAAVGLALGRRDGLTMDAYAFAAIRYLLAPTRFIPHEPAPAAAVPAWIGARARQSRRRSRMAPLALPARQVTDPAGVDIGLVDLGPDGLAVVAAASTVNFALRTPEEQEALVGVFARWLHTLTGPAQLLVRAERVDLSALIIELDDRAAALPHPALEQAARDHVAFLADLAEDTELLRRQVLLVLREPTSAGAAQLAHRLEQARRTLSAAGILVTPLDAPTAVAVLAAVCDPTLARPAGTAQDWAPPGAVITTAAEEQQ